MPCKETECKCELTKTELTAAGLGIFGNCKNSTCDHPVGNHTDTSAAGNARAPWVYDDKSNEYKFWHQLENAKLKISSSLDCVELDFIYSAANKVETFDREGVATRELMVRKCYDPLCALILEAAKVDRHVYVSGTPGIGKTTFRNYVAWKILQEFKGKKIAVVMLKGGGESMDVYQSDGTKSWVESWKSADDLVKHLERQGFVLGGNFFFVADVSRGDLTGLTGIARALIIFSSPNVKVWKEGFKEKASRFFMPLWEENELLAVQKTADHCKVLQERFVKYGGEVRYIWGSEKDIKNHETQLRKALTDESLEGLQSNDWEKVEPKFVHLRVPELKEGGYDYASQQPTLQMATRYVARLAAKGVIARHLDKTRKQFTVAAPSVFGMLFEAICVELLLRYALDAPFYLRRLSHSKTHIHKQLRSLLTACSGTYCFRPAPPTLVDFNSEKDVLSAVDNGLKTHSHIFALPRSTKFAGFDAIYAWKKEGKKAALLLQATTSKKHPMSHEGVKILAEFASAFEVDIVYFVEIGQQYSFEAQELAKDPPPSALHKTLFESTPQWSLIVSVGAPLPAKEATVMEDAGELASAPSESKLKGRKTKKATPASDSEDEGAPPKGKKAEKATSADSEEEASTKGKKKAKKAKKKNIK